MGKPFKKELLELNKTYDWGFSIEIPQIENWESMLEYPSFVVGSGGSFSACHFFSLLMQSKGILSKAVTPLELHYSSNSIRNSNVVFLSASGKNSDILFAYKTALNHDPKCILGLCMQENTKLGHIAVNDSISNIIEINCPAGKDGFLATNSLIGYFIVLSRMFGYAPEIINFNKDIYSSFNFFISKLHPDFTLHVMYGGWGMPVAIDIESKFTEAGLGNVLLADYRNFAHGRHNWFDKKKKQSAIIALITPQEKLLAERTLSLLPQTIPVCIIETNYYDACASLDLLVKSFYLVSAIGDHVKIDPGKPGVPSYGSKLYNLQYSTMIANRKAEMSPDTANAILRKSKKKYIGELSTNELSYWNEHYKNYKKKINNGKYSGLIIDYDGTICSKEERNTQPRGEVISTLINLLEMGFIIGIITGRGKSVRETLQKCLPENLWKNLIVGYYNGSEIGFLDDDKLPNTTSTPKYCLAGLENILKKYVFLSGMPDITLRPHQLTIEKSAKNNWKDIKNTCIDLIAKSGLTGFEVLESSHSIDVISRPEVSKKNIFELCYKEAKKRGQLGEFLCIGDKGRYPGNDYEFLTSPFSLSVDETSIDPYSCWNFSKSGQNGIRSYLYYMGNIKFFKNYFSIAI